MGVTGLWQIVQPTARPIKLETLNRKRLAVDASIWIYQFLKAVRDKEGNALRNSHVVGFFRRICKLLFFGIKPVFVFDGGAPALKRQVIKSRKQRREGRREDAVRTAGKLLAVQMQRRAEEEEQKRKEKTRYSVGEEEETVPDGGLVYVEELQMSAQERQQSRKFRKKDAYHLPDLDVSMQEMGQPNDPRIMSLEELEAYARQFDAGEDINVYDFSKIDYDSMFFQSLPASDRYNILNAARLRSRLRMGHSKEQLDSMFPDRMAFSRFQIERVRERNELTQRLMRVNGADEDLTFGINGSARVAGEKGREYVLVKNDGVEGGWALGVIGGDEGSREDQPIDIDKPVAVSKQESDDDDDEGFEDVPIEGLNRLPKRREVDDPSASNDSFARQRKALYKSRRSGPKRRPKKPQAQVEGSSFFLEEEPIRNEEEDASVGSASTDSQLFGEAGDDEENEQLQKAIALSMQNDEPVSAQQHHAEEEQDDEMAEVFHQRAVEEAMTIPKGSGRSIANIVNQRALRLAPDRHEKFSFGVPVPISREPTREESQAVLQPFDVHPQGSKSSAGLEDRSDSDEDDELDFRAAMAQSTSRKRKSTPDSSHPGPSPQTTPPKPVQSDIAKKNGFSGPLPFESLDLGSSILGKKKMQKRQEEQAGGFTNPALGKQEKKAESLPPWFAERDLEADLKRQRDVEREDREAFKQFQKGFVFDKAGHDGRLRRNDTSEIIDLDAEDEKHAVKPFRQGEVVDLLAEDDESPADQDGSKREDGHDLQPETTMDDLAAEVRASPPKIEDVADPQAYLPTKGRSAPKSAPHDEDEMLRDEPLTERTRAQATYDSPSGDAEERRDAKSRHNKSFEGPRESEDEEIEWSASEDERSVLQPGRPSHSSQAATPLDPLQKHALSPVRARSPSLEFEEVPIPHQQLPRPASPNVDFNTQYDEDMDVPVPASGLAHQDSVPEDPDFDYFSDPEDEALLRSLELEAEEHARFASELNQKTPAQNVMDYERELKQLRNQQKKDRRDADEVTHIMIGECQQLLRLFGLPFVTAPMEAEAQCAELGRLGLVDGIVTDDSDCFLFGGTRIYKNMFNQAKFVECYLTSDMEKEFALTREKLIGIAHLLGSDYTEGLPGVGPVTAMEILSEFGDVQEFKEWWTGVQMNSIPKSADAGNTFRKKFRKNGTKLFLSPTFPDKRVDLAYLNPEVDSDPEPFQWGVPDLDALRSFLMATIGWSQDRTDEVLVPVIRDMNRRADEGTQANITAFFEGSVGVGAAGNDGGRGEGFAPRRRVEGSTRMGTALNKLAEKAKTKAQQKSSAAGSSKDRMERAAGKASKDVDSDRVRKKGSTTRAKRTAHTASVADGDPGDEQDDSDFIEGARRKKKKRSTASDTTKRRGQPLRDA